MRAKAFVVIAAMLIGGLAWAAPAAAAGETITGQDMDYTPRLDNSNTDLPFIRFTHKNVETHIDVVVTLGGKPFPMTAVNGCADEGTGKFECVAGGAQLTFTVGPGALLAAAQATGAATPTVIAIATIEDSTVTATSHIYVKPQADLAITGLAVRNYGGANSAKLEFNVTDAGPSGSLRTTVVVTGYHSRPTQSLGSGCAWSGALKVTCTFHGGIAERVGESFSLPLVTAQAGCAYRVAVSGTYPDPKSSNNVATITNHGESCEGSTTVAASGTPKTPAASASPSPVKPAVTSAASAGSAPTKPAAPDASAPPMLRLAGANFGGHRIMIGYAIALLVLLACGVLLVRRA